MQPSASLHSLPGRAYSGGTGESGTGGGGAVIIGDAGGPAGGTDLGDGAATAAGGPHDR